MIKGNFHGKALVGGNGSSRELEGRVPVRGLVKSGFSVLGGAWEALSLSIVSGRTRGIWACTDQVAQPHFAVMGTAPCRSCRRESLLPGKTGGFLERARPTPITSR